MRYYIADLHFFHEALNNKMDKRGFADVGEMNEYIIQKWNNKVRKNDDVVIIGDLSFGSGKETNELLKRLNGRLYLIKGNHDYFLSSKDMDLSRFVWIKPYDELSDNKRKVPLPYHMLQRTVSS